MSRIDRNWLTAGLERPVVGSIMLAKPIPIEPPMISPATSGAAKAICTTKPSASPTSASAATDRKVDSANTVGGTAIVFVPSTRIATAPDSATRTCTGTETLPNTGAATNAAPTRTITNSSAHSCGSIARPKPSITRSARAPRATRAPGGAIRG